MEKINLEKILRNQIGYMGNEPNLTRLISDRAIGKDILNAMKEACKQTLKHLFIYLKDKENFSIFELQEIIKKYEEEL